MIKIAFFDTKPYDKQFFEDFNSDELKIKFYESHLTPDTVTLAKGYDAVCAFVNDTISEETIDKLVALDIKLIAMRCAGYNNVDLEAAKDKITIVRVPAYSPYSIAEHAVSLIMALNRKTHRAYQRTRENNFRISGLLGFDLNGRTAGIVGTGKIGQCLIKILKGFGMNVVAYDAYPNQKVADELGFTYVELEDLYKQADIISLHCPLLESTHHMINEKSIAAMKDGVMIINTSRGALINSKALIEGLKSKKVGFAGLDVYEEEEAYFFEDVSDEILDDDDLARLLSFNNVIVTSHQAFFTRDALTNIADTTVSNVQEFFINGKAPNEVL